MPRQVLPPMRSRFVERPGQIRFIRMRQAEQDVTVFLHLFTAFAQLLFGLAELLVRLYEFDITSTTRFSSDALS